MTLEAYLMEKLNLTEEEAVKICEAFRSYKKEYGRGGKHGFGKHGRDSRGGGSFKEGFHGEKDRESLKQNSASEGSQDLSQPSPATAVKTNVPLTIPAAEKDAGWQKATQDSALPPPYIIPRFCGCPEFLPDVHLS